MGLLLILNQAMACGYCVEDKIAAIYDHAVVQQAKLHQLQVLFFEINGADAESLDKYATPLKIALSKLPDLDSTTIRMSTQPPAISFAYRNTMTAKTVAQIVNARLAEDKIDINLNLLQLSH